MGADLTMTQRTKQIEWPTRKRPPPAAAAFILLLLGWVRDSGTRNASLPSLLMLSFSSHQAIDSSKHYCSNLAACERSI
jgi:hypothetical protein